MTRACMHALPFERVMIFALNRGALAMTARDTVTRPALQTRWTHVKSRVELVGFKNRC